MTARTLLLLALLASPVRAEDVTIKLATLAPVGSTWHVLLKDAAERVARVSGGSVKLKIYAGGTQGNETDMVRKMALGQLGAASLSNLGLADITPEPAAFSAPGMLTEDTVGPVLDALAPTMEAALLARGYEVLHWARVGTVYVFCKKPYRTPEEAGDGKFFVWGSDPGSVEAMRLIGWRPVVLSSTDIIPSLQTGMISCVTQNPAIVLATRMHELTPTMVDYPWSYLVGATVVRKEVWARVDPAIRDQIKAIGVEMGKQVDAEVRRLNADAIAAMKKQKLTVIPVDAAPWTAGARRAWPAVRGKVAPAEFFDRVVEERDRALAGR